MIMAGERGISPNVTRSCWPKWALIAAVAAICPLSVGVLHGDLGISLKSRIPVWQEFVPRFKATLELGVCAMIFAVAVGIPVGVLAAVKRGSILTTPRWAWR